jgi:hypothetical protein
MAAYEEKRHQILASEIMDDQLSSFHPEAHNPFVWALYRPDAAG